MPSCAPKDIGAKREMLPLCAARPGQEMRVVKLHAKAAQKGLLESLGFVENTPLRVVAQTGGGALVEVKGARVALDSQLARCLLVAPATDEKD